MRRTKNKNEHSRSMHNNLPTLPHIKTMKSLPTFLLLFTLTGSNPSLNASDEPEEKNFFISEDGKLFIYPSDRDAYVKSYIAYSWTPQPAQKKSSSSKKSISFILNKKNEVIPTKFESVVQNSCTGYYYIEIQD